jgi:hypothetical protein
VRAEPLRSVLVKVPKMREQDETLDNEYQTKDRLDTEKLGYLSQVGSNYIVLDLLGGRSIIFP